MTWQDIHLMRSVLLTMSRTVDCIMAIRTTLKKLSSTTLLFRSTIYASATKVLIITSFQSGIMLHNVMSILQMRFVGLRTAMLY